MRQAICICLLGISFSAFLFAVPPNCDFKPLAETYERQGVETLAHRISRGKGEKLYLIEENPKTKLSEKDIAEIQSILEREAKKKKSVEPFGFVEFHLSLDEPSLGLNFKMDAQGREQGAVDIDSLFTSTEEKELLSRLYAFAVDRVLVAGRLPGVFRGKRFKPKAVALRLYVTDHKGGLPHKDPGNTLTHAFQGPQTIIDGVEIPTAQSVFFNSKVEHSFPPSRKGRLILIMGDG